MPDGQVFLRWLALLLVGCALPTEDTGARQQPLLGAEPSTPEEDAAVLVRAGHPDEPRCDPTDSLCNVCSGRLVAPRLVLTAHHCLLRSRLTALNCAPDGTAIGDADADLSLELPGNLAVYVGHEYAALRRVNVERVVAGFIPSVCNHDLAYLVLSEPALEARTPLRRTPVRIGERFSISGWGFTLGGGEPLPDQRHTRVDLLVDEVGPGPQTPDGMFATGGASLCQGDSGSVAVIEGAVVGVYSRLSGPCAATTTRNFLQGIATTQALTKDAFAAIGEEPTYVTDDDQPPSSAPGGCALPSSAPSWLLLVACVGLAQRRLRTAT